jgi:poly-gamma-glutamate synthesis protein (capsule biosynthesis protein)
MNRHKQRKFIISIGLVLTLFVLLSAIPGELFSASKKMTLAALGDCIISRKVSVQKDPGFLKLVGLIRSADCAWANCELPLVDIGQAYSQYREQDIPGAAEPWCADELKWLGVDFVGFANNHTMDYGHEGLFSTIENLKRVGIEYAGAGKDLEEAARPRYADTPGGRVGQVNCASAIHPGTHASLPTPYINGRPGLNPLRIEDTIRLKKESYETLKKIIDEMESLFREKEEEKKETGEDKEKDKDEKKPEEELKIENIKIVPGEKTEYLGAINEKDLQRITDAVKVAKRNARIVIVSIHAHRGMNKGKSPAKFIETFARSCVDAGADVVFNTGPHRLWGIEIYKKKPIFYSLGNFFFQIGTESHFPSETYIMLGLDPNTRDASLVNDKLGQLYFKEKSYWESFVPMITFENENDITDIKLYPVVLGKDEPGHRQGTPGLAEKKEAKTIIEELTELSQPYKTKIEFRDGIGVVHLK